MGGRWHTRNCEELIEKSLARRPLVWNDAWMIASLLAVLAAISITLFSSAPVYAVTTPTPATPTPPAPNMAAPAAAVPVVPFYSQFKDITSLSWQKVGCGIASLAMLVDYYKPAVPVDTLLKQGIASGAYLQNAGWTYKGLIGVAGKYGLMGTSYDLAELDKKGAYAQLKKYLEDGPVMASIHYQFDPASTIPHLVVINAVVGDVVYYNDPAAKAGEGEISAEKFLLAWKKRFIVLRPAKETADVAVATQERA